MQFSTRQLDIIHAATNLLGQKGIQNLTTKSLAAEIGFSEPALYRHFKSKTDILESVLIYYQQVLKQGLSDIIESDETGLEKIRLMMKFQFNHFTLHPSIIMVIFAETSFQYDNVLSKAVSDILHQKSKMVNMIIKSGQAEGSIRADISADQLVTIVIGAMRFTVLKWRLSDFNFSLIDEGNVLWTTIHTLIKKENISAQSNAMYSSN
jgi:AcrR family transcriptional regulator